ncbi:hypothetical protein INR49_001747 [Caranx melampygus]|nr:hypothetical protein INR49_001747 [Caranx melampygus]
MKGNVNDLQSTCPSHHVHPANPNHRERAYMSLMRGLTELDLCGPAVPSDLVLTGDHAFPLAMNSKGQVLMAASLYSRGRIVVLGHEAYLTAFPALVENALTWLRGDGSDNVSVGIHKNVKAVANNLSKASFQASVVGAFSDNPRVGVYVTDAYSVGADPKDLVAFLKAGGGVLIAGQAWSWAADHPRENVLLQFGGNKVSGVAGVYFSGKPSEAEYLPVYPQIPSSWMAVTTRGVDQYRSLPFSWYEDLHHHTCSHRQQGWKVQIGCQTDKLKDEELKRAPSVHERFPITSEMMQLEFDNIILTVPSSAIRDLEHPDKLEAHWDAIMKGIADLAAIPHKLPRKERFVADVQISHGWMHAGYPIMMFDIAASELISIDKARTEGIWGPIHELGHNQQRGCWEFRPHTTECTCNLWSVYVHEEVLGINKAKLQRDLTPENRKKRTEEYVTGGKKIDSWTMWVALETYLQFDFGDETFCSEVLVHGPLAFPIGTTEDGKAFLAGAYYGQGRVIVISHEGLLGQKTLAPFWINALHWLDEGRNGVVGVAPDLDEAFTLFSESEFNCKKTNLKEDLSVFVCKAYSDKHMEEMQNFVAEGGGLLIGGHAWYWEQTHDGENPMTEFSGNKILNKMGLSLLEHIIEGSSFKAPVPSQAIKDTYHFRHLLHRFAGHVNNGEALSGHEEKCLKKLGGHCASYLSMRAHDCPSYVQVMSTLTDILKKSGIPQVGKSCPVKSPKDHLLLSMAADVYKVCPNPDALLPYLIKDNPVMPVVYNQRIMVNVDTAEREEWISTGLYLSPGMKTYIIIPAAIVNKGWKVQIGCQTDKLDDEELKRAPSVHEQFPITSEMMQVWNLWGGSSTSADWSLLRTAPSPWAELEFDNIILTVPSSAIRDLEHPDKLEAHWDAIMRGIADLAAIPHKLPRKERFVADVQISYGWMHAGYPIMMFDIAASELISIDKARTEGIWGPIHELGHNQQRECWEFPPHTTECTCNLWSVYVHEEVLGINRGEKGQSNLTPEKRRKRTEEYVTGGKKIDSWEIWVALETYLQLQEKFGWDAFKKVFAAYHGMSNFPGDNEGKMNLYAETFSKTVGMNLCGFFKAWGWPIKPDTEKKVSNLPPWKDHPMVQYG